MRMVRDDEACDRFEATCERLADLSVRASQDGPEIVSEWLGDEHVSRCPACAGAVRAAQRLYRSRGAEDVPDPGPDYWRGFSGRLSARLEEPVAGTGSPRSWRAKLAVALAASVILAGGALVVRHVRSTAISAPTEAELLLRLDQAPEERVAEWLDEIAPTEIGTAPEDLADAESLLGDDDAAPEDDSPYDLFLDLGDDDRARLLKEMRGEIG